MEQENRNQQNAAPQVSLGNQIKVRREKSKPPVALLDGGGVGRQFALHSRLIPFIP